MTIRRRNHAPCRRRGPRRISRVPAVAGGLVAVLPVLFLSACAPPDRPPQLPAALPETLVERVEPDSTRTTRVAPGVWYRYLWAPEGPWAAHLVEVDLRRCELGLDVVRAPKEPGKPGGHAPVTELVRAMRDSGSVLVAVNGDFFTPEGTPLGPEVTDGATRTPRARPALAWRPGRGPWIGTAASDSAGLRVGWRVGVAGADSATRVVGGFPELLDRGARVGDLAVESNPGFAASRHPRTAVGWAPETGRLWLVVVDGRQGGYSLGMTLPELTGLLESLGVTEALNLDGGGSSVMVLRGRAVSRPSDDEGERPVANALLLRRDPEAYCR